MEIVFQESSFKTELIAEVVEYAAEEIGPYECLESGRCDLAVRTTIPFLLSIDAPLQVTLQPITGPFGQKGFRAIDAQFIRDEMAISTVSLEELKQAQQDIEEAAREAMEDLQNLEQDANRMLEQILGQ